MIISKWRKSSWHKPQWLKSSRASKLVGCLDQIDRRILRGWVFDPSRPAKRLTVDVFCEGALIGQATTGFARPDLEAAGLGDGRHQFVMDMSTVPERALEAVFVTVSQYPGVEITTTGISHLDAWRADRRLTTRELRAMFEPLLREDHYADGCQSDNRRSCNPSLLIPNLVFGLPLSAFARHIALKFGCSGEWKRDEFDRFLDWYINEYAVYQIPKRVPWSSEEIAFWSTIASHRPFVCRASQRFAPRAPGLSLADAAYAWAVEDSRRLVVEDIFVHPTLAARLRAIPHTHRWQSFPLSRFMRRFLAENARLRNLPTRRVAERQVVYAIVMLYGLTSPHLLAYIPSRWLAAMFDNASSRRPFREALTILGLQTSEDIAERYLGMLDRRGYDVRAQQWTHLQQDTADVADSADAEFDVQLIGPLSQTLGLGESARRIAAALMQCDVSVHLVDYDLGNASPRRPVDLPLGSVATARVTILHLNLEEIPEALAYLHDNLSGCYLVAFPYFELSAPSAAHMLGARLVQEIWVASTFLQSVFEKVCERTYLVGMSARSDVPASLEDNQSTRLDPLFPTKKTFVFLVTADALSWIQRKNVLGVLDAFQSAFDESAAVCLLVKTHNRAHTAIKTEDALWSTIIDRAAQDERLVLVDETFDEDTYRSLLARVDCLVSLHRAEGLGLDLLDAMAIGTAVVATAYSGNAGFCNDRICWPVSFDLNPVEPGTYPYAEAGDVWAEPKGDDAVENLRRVYEDARERKERTERASQYVATTHSLRAVSDRIAARLRDIGLEPIRRA